MIAVIDYDTGNLCSVANALGRLGAEYRITASPDEIRGADRVLLPGVGEASSAMQKLRERSLVEVIRSLTQPVLGICIGVQLLCQSSEEGDTACIGIFDNRVRKFDTLFAEAGIPSSRTQPAPQPLSQMQAPVPLGRPTSLPMPPYFARQAG
ncbi:MAG: imidazole glycerol phosphate synthase subunit HisH [Alistipes indistinctus]